eukprot:SAG31_NODE_8845_length_1376_cov_2.115897_1_plen_57_part_10
MTIGALEATKAATAFKEDRRTGFRTEVLHETAANLFGSGRLASMRPYDQTTVNHRRY